VLLDDVRTEEDAVRAGERVLLALSGPISLGERTVSVRASIGVAVDVDDAWSTDEILRNADVAMYIAKSHGKACVRLFEASMHDALLDRLELESELERAVELNQLVLHYQPIVELPSGRIAGFEALVRWNHPTRGLLPPNDFIPLAEETGHVLPIDRWVLLQACSQARSWQREGLVDDGFEVSVNLSMRQLEDERVVDIVRLALDVSGLAPSCLVLEVTESFVLQDEVAGAKRLRALRDLGVRLAIDDFGTGYSSLSYLRQLPVDILKIDRSFVAGLGSNEDDSPLVLAILSLADSLGLDTIAEGIETADQRDALVVLGCTHGQGWHFSRAVEAAQLHQLLVDQSQNLTIMWAPPPGVSFSTRSAPSAASSVRAIGKPMPMPGTVV
jgi:EAL domain-containing protein (putative c-di-GMP-specific phosphodiesterase class I)